MKPRALLPESLHLCYAEPVDFPTRSILFNRCKPSEPLAPDDSRNVPFDHEQGRVRGIDWVERLAAKIEMSDTPACELFTGLPGSGKSTELLRLKQRLGDKAASNFLVVYVNAEEQLDLTNTVDVPDILASLVAAADRDVAVTHGSKDGSPGFLKRFWDWMNTTDVELTEAKFAVQNVVDLTLELKTRPTLRQKVHEIVSSHLNFFLKLVHDEIRILEGRAKETGRRGLVLIFDSLEKLQGMSYNYDAVLASAERLFAGGAPYLTLPVHTIYTIPPALVARRAFHEVNFLPMVRVTHQDGSPSKSGLRALRELVRRRVSDDELKDQLGMDYEARTQRLIAWSGGYPRELVRLLQGLWQFDQTLSDADLDRVCNEVTDSYRKVIRSRDAAWLAQVALDHYVTTADETEQRSADRMLSSNAVLRYLNDRDWFDLHPAVRCVPEVASAITARSTLSTQQTE